MFESIIKAKLNELFIDGECELGDLLKKIEKLTGNKVDLDYKMDNNDNIYVTIQEN